VAGVQPNSPSLTISRSALAQRASCTRSIARSIGACTSVPPSKPWPISSSSAEPACGALGRASSRSISSSGPPKAISRQPRCSRCAVRSASSTTALAMFSGAPRIEPEVSRHTMMGPRSSASGCGGAAPGAAAQRGRAGSCSTASLS
jgi:hypothetical protein